MKGILLAGGSGSRLYPNTLTTSKQLLPVYDKPTIYYPLTSLMLAGIRDILVISTERDIPQMKNLLGNGERFGIRLSYQIQTAPRGIAEAMILGEKFIQDEPSVLILGDNLFYGNDLGAKLNTALEKAQKESLATIFAHRVSDPERYGVVTLDESGKPSQLIEKPTQFISPWAITGLYVYPQGVSKHAASLKPSKRGELEITDLNNIYLKKQKLNVEFFGRGYAWLDTGTSQSLLEASQFVATLENRQGQKIGCPEEIALQCGFISADDFSKILDTIPQGSYRNYLVSSLEAHHEISRYRG